MDKYDEQIQELTERPERICEDWRMGIGLFAWTGGNFACGCLTQIKSSVGYYVPERPDLTAQIRADERIPNSVNFITVESLPAFAEWQRILDREVRK